MHFDEAWREELPGAFDRARACRDHSLGRRSDRGDAIITDQDCGVLNRWSAVAWNDGHVSDGE
jgi:hypothetical protein